MEELELKDCGEQIIKCSDCNKDLLCYRVYVPNAPIVHKIQVLCPFCSSKSFVKEIKGMMVVGPVSSEKSNYPTVIGNIKSEGDKSIFEMQKR